jgi:hypothetical protein
MKLPTPNPVLELFQRRCGYRLLKEKAPRRKEGVYIPPISEELVLPRQPEVLEIINRYQQAAVFFLY